MFKEDTPAIHPEAVFNVDSNNNKKTIPLVTYLVCYCLLCGYFPDPRYDLSNFLYPRVLTEVFYLVVYGQNSNLVLHNRNGFNINTINIIVSYIFLFNYIISGVNCMNISVKYGRGKVPLRAEFNILLNQDKE